MRKTFGVLGGEKLDRVAGKQVDLESKISFLFQFSRRWYQVEPGQQLRVVLDTWRDEKSFRDHERPIHLATPPFRCPVTEIGAA